MQQIILAFLLILIPQSVFSQERNTNDKQEIRKMLSTFMQCLVEKDSIKFYNLFHKDPVVWVGVTQEKSHKAELKKDSTEKDYFWATYKQFYHRISNVGANEEKFYNVNIIEDGYIASVIFDYSFWKNKKKQNWGKESWGLIKTNHQWKITSVIFSLEYEEINPEPKKK